MTTATPPRRGTTWTLILALVGLVAYLGYPPPQQARAESLLIELDGEDGADAGTARDAVVVPFDHLVASTANILTTTITVPPGYSGMRVRGQCLLTGTTSKVQAVLIRLSDDSEVVGTLNNDAALTLGAWWGYSYDLPAGYGLNFRCPTTGGYLTMTALGVVGSQR